MNVNFDLNMSSMNLFCVGAMGPPQYILLHVFECVSKHEEHEIILCGHYGATAVHFCKKSKEGPAIDGRIPSYACLASQGLVVCHFNLSVSCVCSLIRAHVVSYYMNCFNLKARVADQNCSRESDPSSEVR